LKASEPAGVRRVVTMIVSVPSLPFFQLIRLGEPVVLTGVGACLWVSVCCRSSCHPSVRTGALLALESPWSNCGQLGRTVVRRNKAGTLLSGGWAEWQGDEGAEKCNSEVKKEIVLS